MSQPLLKKDFYFDLPQELIAQHPIYPRDHSRLLQLDRTTGEIAHKHFYDIVDVLQPGDTLVVNDSKVLPARLYGHKEDTGAKAEVLLLKKQATEDLWECLVKPGRKIREGTKLVFGEGLLTGEVCKVCDDGNRIIRFACKGRSFYDVIDQIGQMPLPHYITAELEDKDRYQTVYAHERGSAAAPTAGLHFTEELLERLRQKGVVIARVTLHVGLGTFRPVKEENVLDHKMHTEHYVIPQETADAIALAKKNGKRVIAVGTTSCRTLESCYQKNGAVVPFEDDTSIFIYPGYTFGVIDGMITNFHLPESTLIMLVSALAGREPILNAYQVAVQEKYRFYSFGDAMLIL
ncbi:tRNA preQ1(34) S-adenosylmethionine ribosyltransferase-isomerase QueA [Neobittarella massiliensis]|uniref:S-adenosylmethionine:tRNA ribosyltransferase-isomerase n=1 Tax=Neobittarella massiliensis (ex Bilen et al. 2018) TaxID=2041842 RepID=A0A8J6LYK4_9FIRM|nr:tRNA preQ1(34) S-adenosylmethionine ribosyltransferase-isomerase QueA [Neobittarella massiliensis]MBC3515762.1 tRNA preQ1(34) S-adenosylmethionine ribosyltransferase-isomerase QueA [Neobittarella massiliensis]